MTSTRACTTRSTWAVPRLPTSTRSPRGSRTASGLAATAARAARTSRRTGLGSTTHLAVHRCRRQLRLGHLLERDGLGSRGARHGRARQQHARRGGPEPAGLPPDPSGPPGQLDDVPDAGAARRRGRARAGQRRLQSDPLGDPADDASGSWSRRWTPRRRWSPGGFTSRPGRCRRSPGVDEDGPRRPRAPRRPGGSLEAEEPLLRRGAGRPARSRKRRAQRRRRPASRRRGRLRLGFGRRGGAAIRVPAGGPCRCRWRAQRPPRRAPAPCPTAPRAFASRAIRSSSSRISSSCCLVSGGSSIRAAIA